MDLRTGTSIWTQRAPLELSRGPLADDVTCDVLVIGTGITGALVAHRLATLGCDVVMLDRRTLARGSTVASTALIQYEVVMPLVRLADRIGAAAAREAYRQTRAPGDLPDARATEGARISGMAAYDALCKEAASDARKPILECVPSQKGLFVDAPQRHNEITCFPLISILFPSASAISSWLRSPLTT